MEIRGKEGGGGERGLMRGGGALGADWSDLDRPATGVT